MVHEYAKRDKAERPHSFGEGLTGVVAYSSSSSPRNARTILERLNFNLEFSTSSIELVSDSKKAKKKKGGRLT